MWMLEKSWCLHTAGRKRDRIGEARFAASVANHSKGVGAHRGRGRTESTCATYLKGNADLLFIEVKNPGLGKRSEPTELQHLKMEELKSFGDRCIVAHSVEEVERELPYFGGHSARFLALEP